MVEEVGYYVVGIKKKRSIIGRKEEIDMKARDECYSMIRKRGRIEGGSGERWEKVRSRGGGGGEERLRGVCYGKGV